MTLRKTYWVWPIVYLMLTSPAAGGSQRARGLASPAGRMAVSCSQGFVWREAFPGDYVCVTSESRSLVTSENRDPAHAEPCQPGTVWRESRPSHHICVSLERRAEVADENRLASGRVAGAVIAPALGTACAQGFVWREAFPGDYVCVTSGSRSMVTSENQDPADAEPCQPGTVWREARPSDHICVSLARRSAVAEENRSASTRVAGAPPSFPLPAPPPSPPPPLAPLPTGGQTGDLSNDTEGLESIRLFGERRQVVFVERFDLCVEMSFCFL